MQPIAQAILRKMDQVWTCTLAGLFLYAVMTTVKGMMRIAEPMDAMMNVLIEENRPEINYISFLLPSEPRPVER